MFSSRSSIFKASESKARLKYVFSYCLLMCSLIVYWLVVSGEVQAIELLSSLYLKGGSHKVSSEMLSVVSRHAWLQLSR